MRKIIANPEAINGHGHEPPAPTPEADPPRRRRQVVAQPPLPASSPAPFDDLMDLADPVPGSTLVDPSVPRLADTVPLIDVAPPMTPNAPTAATPLLRVVNAIISQDPEKLFRDLEQAEKLRGRTLTALVEELEMSLPNASKASRLAMICSRAARLYKLAIPEREALLRDRARAEIPKRTNKEGAEKAPTVQELGDWIATHYAAEQRAISAELIDLETLAEHAANLARIWSYRSRDIQEMSAAQRAQGSTAA